MLIDLGFNIQIRERIRLLHVDTPEMRGESREEGIKAKEATEEWLNQHAGESKWPFSIKTEKADSFGRYLTDIVSQETGESLAQHLIELGHPGWSR